MGYGLGLGFRMMEFNAGFKLLDMDEVARMYRKSFRRILLFDYGDTLVSIDNQHKFSKYAAPTTKKEVGEAPSHIVKLLESLCEDPRNTVFVLSGRDKLELQKMVGNVRGLGLAAEHGYYYRWGDNRNEGWACTKENFDDSWKDVTHSVMDIYTQVG